MKKFGDLLFPSQPASGVLYASREDDQGGFAEQLNEPSPCPETLKVKGVWATRN
jgi:hypothetical protein